MKASSLPVLLLVLGLAAAGPVAAQDTVILKSGVTREGKITGVSGGNVRIQTPNGTVGTPVAEVREIRMSAPPEFDAAASQLASGDAKGAVAALTKINETFAGLPAAWAERAAALLGDAKLAAGDKEGAAAAYDNLTKTYPQATALANLGRARLAVDDGKFDEASPLLQPLLANADKTAFPAAADGPPLCQANYLMGRVQEAAGDHQAALASYLKASALFPFDKNAAADAQKRADALRAEHAGLIAP
ncbi:MAG: tetratricopeptide repeat protein [Chthoniobacterales bacterium]